MSILYIYICRYVDMYGIYECMVYMNVCVCECLCVCVIVNVGVMIVSHVIKLRDPVVKSGLRRLAGGLGRRLRRLRRRPSRRALCHPLR